ncbi:hypothetical protein TNCV_3673751 [Trichonephila clavipes]|nr:hypothetical protein TNCV_3673751 [Trichonephila clavipes]
MSSFLVLCEEDTRNRWLDGQVCPDVRQGTMAPWARRLGCVLACYAQIGRGRSRETFERRKKPGGDGKGERERERGRTEKKRWRVGDGKREENESGRERERRPPCMEKRAESGDWSEKDDERRWR